MNLNPRAQQLLKTLIDIYISDGQPVASKTLAQTSGLDVSSATIRNVMCQLDKQGLIHAPYTSAGRIPTEKGYRFFIDSLMEVQPLTADFLGAVNSELNADQSAGRLVNNASSLLSDFTQMAGIVTLPKRSQLTLRQIEFLPLPGNRILAILVINEKEVENRVIQTDREYSQSELQTVSNIINSQYAGKDVFSIRTSLVETLHKASNNLDQQMKLAADIAGKALQENNNSSDYVMQGKTKLLNFADLEETGKLQQMFQLFNNTRDMLNILDRCINADGVKVYVGNESGIDGLGNCSLITAPYHANGEVLGVLGVVGPTRMNYKNVIPVVEITAKFLGQALKTEY
ncbi:MAG: heat-inducible transcriptional repressor HrcA [Gammaproteobacteria bacterium]|nr:heat-inducible transcriptional repressor HrcA [Gammaproteobacteria bacterium]